MGQEVATIHNPHICCPGLARPGYGMAVPRTGFFRPHGSTRRKFVVSFKGADPSPSSALTFIAIIVSSAPLLSRNWREVMPDIVQSSRRRAASELSTKPRPPPPPPLLGRRWQRRRWLRLSVPLYQNVVIKFRATSLLLPRPSHSSCSNYCT